jgi:F0F1-type ATP synthase gamma subunit
VILFHFVCFAAFYEKAEITQDEKKPNHLIVAMTSDRGLCGSVHSNIVRAIRASVPTKPAGTVSSVSFGSSNFSIKLCAICAVN